MSRLYEVIEVEADGSCLAHDLEHRSRRVSLLAYDGPPVRPGDWVTVHSGYALAPVPREEAEAVRAMLDI